MSTPPPEQPGRARAAFDWCFRSREDGRITIAQPPNVALWIFIAAWLVRLVLPEDSAARSTVGWIGTATLGWWAVDELVRGVNPWRRVLGAAGCLLVLARLAAVLT